MVAALIFSPVVQFVAILFYTIFAVLNLTRPIIMSIIQTIRDKGAAIVIGIFVVIYILAALFGGGK